MDVTLSQADGRYVLRLRRHLAHPPARVWRALTTPEELRHWFPADLDGALEPGGVLTFTFREGEAPPSGGTVVALEPGHLFEFTWQDETLRWELAPDGGGTLLTFTHTFDDGPGAAGFAAGWVACLGALDAALSGTTTSAGWSAELHDRFLDTFGLREGVLETTPAGWRVRFVRQLTRPADVVEKVLADMASTPGRTPLPDADWQFTPGPGGARAVLTVTGSDTSADQAYADARRALDELAAQLRRR
ncbi:SRPBCC family protein [Cryptosporangium sp. NPDC051539]|uniref:SRPBCC family protein n=1 Tax=Cryptosporangium sp. NPDC051539 TaxID=3363962 RepID=UPI0037A449E8